MGKHGPCYHCGVTSTPLWRNGPPEKPILCNACGSRWRTKGTLTNYTPLHARAEPDEFEDYRVFRVKSISLKNKEAKVLKRKQKHNNVVGKEVVPDYIPGSQKSFDEDTSNRSSSGSAISNSESCAQFGSADASDLTGPAQSVVWDTMVPSRKRTGVTRPKPSSVEKLTKDLYTILHEHPSSYFSGSSEEDLLFDSDTPMVSVEIGHGSVLIRHPSSIAREEESEASSLSFENRQYPPNEAYSRSTTFPVCSHNKGVNFPCPGIDKMKRPTGEGLHQEQMKRDKALPERPQFIGNHNSPLCHIDLKDVINLKEFTNNLTKEEQQQLLKFLPSVDTARLPDSLNNMFDSLHFEENLSAFQKLLAEGVFDLSFAGGKSDDCRNLKRLALCDLTKSKWVEKYNVLKGIKYENIDGEPVTTGLNAVPTGSSINLKRPRDGQHQHYPGTKLTMKSPKRVVAKGGYEHEGSCCSPQSLFALPPDSSSLMFNSFHYGDESCDQDLLLEVPSNSFFPQAELLLPTSSFGAQASASSSSGYPHIRP